MSFDYTNKRVEEVLRVNPQARNDDAELILAVWGLYGLDLTLEQEELFLSNKLPSTETIRRTRQKLQAEGKYQAVEPVRRSRKKMAVETRAEIVQPVRVTEQSSMLDVIRGYHQ